MILIKLGGSAVTDKTRDFTVRESVIETVAQQVACIEDQVIVVHGGGSYGHPLARKYRLHKGFTDTSQLQGICETRHAMTALNQLIVSAFIEAGVPAVAVQPSACFVCTNKRISLSFLDPVNRLVDLGCVPVLYGDVVTDTEVGVCILSGDQIVSYLAAQFSVEKVIFGLNVDGLYTKDPRYQDAQLIKEITYADLVHVSGGETGDVTRGMKGKLGEISKMEGTEVILINLLKDGTLSKAVGGKVEGTRIR
jgi:isopentenyl phosphate kinase